MTDDFKIPENDARLNILERWILERLSSPVLFFVVINSAILVALNDKFTLLCNFIFFIVFNAEKYKKWMRPVQEWLLKKFLNN